MKEMKITKIKFYDTSALLLISNLSQEDKNIISYYTLVELENIKNSNKDEEIKYRVRKLLRYLDENPHLYEVEYPSPDSINLFNNDAKIISTAANYEKKTKEEIVFITNDLSQKALAKKYFKNITSITIPKDTYTGYLDVTMNNEEMAYFYSNLDINQYNLLVNQYINIFNIYNEYVDSYIWTGTTHTKVPFKIIHSKYLGDIKPKTQDPYQTLALDSLYRNQITLLNGKAGSGKSLLALGYLMDNLERERISKIIIFCNPVATKDSARLGFYAGDKTTKLLDSQIGNFLIGKFGGFEAVEYLLAQEKLMLMPFSDIRGFDTTGMNCAVYITEGQNLNINLMKLALQRIGEDSICIVEGDMNTQVDLEAYEGNKNGMRRLSEIFRGQPFFGQVQLNTIYRSKIAKIADSM